MDYLTMTIKPHRVGRIAWRAEGGALRFEIERPAEDGHTAYSDFRYTLADDGWRVRRWEARNWLAPSGRPEEVYGLTEGRSSGECDGGTVRLRGLANQREFAVEAPLAAKWTLLETVRRHGNSENGRPLEFSCLDEYAVVHPGHRLEPGEWVEAPGGFRLRPFLHTGAGQVPRVIWVDEAGRVLVWTSGTEGAVLTALGEREGGYTESGYDQRKIELPEELAR
jgi:hypothetical protein